MIIQLYIEGQRVELFKDESVTITDSIQNVKDIEKVFTAFTQSFSVPASKTNNKIFKHYYNYDLVGNNFDARSSKEARIEINDRPYKNGYITLESVKLQFNKPSSYRVTFYGNLKLLRELFNNVKLTNLEWLERFNINDSH